MDDEALAYADELRKVNQSLELKLSRAKAKRADLVEAVYQAARDAAKVARPSVAKPPADRRRHRPEVGLLLLSDWHFGKRTVSYDTRVAHERVALLGQKVARIAEIERADHPVRECHVLLNGDFVDNLNIFPGQAFEVDSSMFAQLFAAAAALDALLTELLAVFPSLHIWEQAGNHGRIGRRGDHPREDNIDMLLYRIVWDRLRGCKRLTWHPSDNWYSVVQIGAYRALLLHGHQIKSFGGQTPAFGITRKVNAWATGVLPPFTDAYLGHFHQPLVLPIANGKGRTFLNPSLESDSDYAKEFCAASGTPGQRLHFVDPEVGRVTSERVLWLD